MQQTLYLIRGVPGSGTNALAHSMNSALIKNDPEALVCMVSTDQFFMSSNGLNETYSFDRRFVGAAHDECYGRTMRQLMRGYTVICHNTFKHRKELQRYINGVNRAALDVEVRIIKCSGREPTSVSRRAIDRIKRNWQDHPAETLFNGELK